MIFVLIFSTITPCVIIVSLDAVRCLPYALRHAIALGGRLNDDDDDNDDGVKRTVRPGTRRERRLCRARHETRPPAARWVGRAATNRDRGKTAGNDGPCRKSAGRQPSLTNNVMVVRTT